MKEYWLVDNKEVAERDTLLMLRGKLEAMRDLNVQPNATELLKWIEETVQEEEERLNKSFPKKAR